MCISNYTPTHGSWLNQIEVWFSILAGRSLKGASFASRSELIAHIDSLIADYKEHADPFVWTKSAPTKRHSNRVSLFSDSGY
jgi:hypothetical protein